MQGIISLGEINYKLLYPFIVSICCFFNYITYYKATQEKEELKYHIFFPLIINSISLMLCGILSIISKYKMKKAIEDKEEAIVVKDLDDSTLSVETNRFSFLRISNKNSYPFLHFIFATVFYFFSSLLVKEFQSQNTMSWFITGAKLIEILIVIFFSFLILHLKIHRHHLLGISIFAICTIFLCLIDATMDFDIKLFFLLFIYSILYSLYQITEKYILNRTRISPYSLLFFEGLFLFFINIIIIIILSNIKCSDNSLLCNSKLSDTIIDINSLLNVLKTSYIVIVYLTLYLLVTTCLNIFRIFTIKEYSPIYRIVADCVVYVYLFIYKCIFENFKFDLTFGMKVICYIFFVLSLLVYNEIIIIKVFSLNVNTQIEIKKRSMDDTDIINELPLDKTI